MVGNQINQTDKSKTRYLKHPHLATRQVGGGGGAARQALWVGESA